jgi:hypothetical protein
MKLNVSVIFALLTAAGGFAWTQIADSLSGIGSQNLKKHYVSPYVNQQGTFVQGDWQTKTNQNSAQLDTYRGDDNPRTVAVAEADTR